MEVKGPLAAVLEPVPERTEFLPGCGQCKLLVAAELQLPTRKKLLKGKLLN